ncbi:MAG: hypothetical protein ACR2P2_06485 [Nakamurella sp.]
MAAPLTTREAGSQPAVGITPIPGGTLAVEVNGYEGSRAGLLRNASKSGRAGSVYWNVDRLVVLSFALHGNVLAVYEGPTLRDGYLGPEDAVQVFNGLDFADPETTVSSAVLALQRYCGVQFSAADVMAVDTFQPFLPVLDEPPTNVEHDEGWRALTAFRVGSEQLAEDLFALDPALCRSVAIWAADEALRVVGLAPELPLASQLAGRPPSTVKHLPDDVLLALRESYRDVYIATRRDFSATDPYTVLATRRKAAGEALLAALRSPDPLDAVVDAVAQARLAAWC